MTINHDNRRQVQRDAREWARQSGSNYTSALRQVGSPLAQGILGERITPQKLTEALDKYPTLGEFGLSSDQPLRNVDGQIARGGLFLGVVLAAEVLRMFTPTANPSISSYSLKHTAETFLGPVMSYVSNGQLIWAAAAIGLPMLTNDGGPNARIAVSEPEHTYARKALGHGNERPGGHDFQPPGWNRLRDALDQFTATGNIGDQLMPVVTKYFADLAFHTWLVGQSGRRDPVGDLARDYTAGTEESEHQIARGPEDLRDIVEAVAGSADVLAAVDSAIAEWRSAT